MKRNRQSNEVVADQRVHWTIDLEAQASDNTRLYSMNCVEPNINHQNPEGVFENCDDVFFLGEQPSKSSCLTANYYDDNGCQNYIQKNGKKCKLFSTFYFVFTKIVSDESWGSIRNAQWQHEDEWNHIDDNYFCSQIFYSQKSSENGKKFKSPPFEAKH